MIQKLTDGSALSISSQDQFLSLNDYGFVEEENSLMKALEEDNAVTGGFEVKKISKKRSAVDKNAWSG